MTVVEINNAIETLEVIWNFRYTAQVTPPRCRKPRDEQREGSFKVKIPCPSNDQAPVAIVEIEKLVDGTTVERKYRWFEGKLWHTKKFNESGLREEPLEAIEQEIKSTWSSYLDEESHVSKIKEWASDLIIVDGVAHYPLPGEPRVFIEYYCPTATESTISVERCFGYYRQDIRKCDYFPVLEFDRALAEKERIYKVQEDLDPQEKLTCECRYAFEVLMPSVLSLNSQADYEEEMEQRFQYQLQQLYHEVERRFSRPEDRLRATRQLVMQLEQQVLG